MTMENRTQNHYQAQEMASQREYGVGEGPQQSTGFAGSSGRTYGGSAYHQDQPLQSHPEPYHRNDQSQEYYASTEIASHPQYHQQQPVPASYVTGPGSIHAGTKNSYINPQISSQPSSDNNAAGIANKYDQPSTSRIAKYNPKNFDKKTQKRLLWIVPLAIIAIVFAALFEHYKSDFERWVEPLTKWLTERDAWSWVIPVAILVILSFPPLFGHEIVQLVVGLAYPIGVAIGIAIAGSVLGEAACFVVFKLFFTKWVDKKIAQKIKWAATARVSQEAGFRGVLVIRYSIVPPHLANPLFACTGMTFWLYMITVILSLPKAVIFVILGNPSTEHSTGAKWGKVVAVILLVIVTVLASRWIRTKMNIAIAEIEAERVGPQGTGDEELGMLGADTHATNNNNNNNDTSYHGAGAAMGINQAPYPVDSSNDSGPHEARTTAPRPYSYEMPGGSPQSTHYQHEQGLGGEERRHEGYQSRPVGTAL